ncbi:hypothetical protein [Micromonospora sp. WMMA1947]|uniref:hypothetical protein n=1 Tax=Micromonospora sp. WMMA1947 TaxID=3015163 RepID=UPI00248AF08D|nr:hypothetical protein [Micromonospora sp. WMMA1947]WBC09461.1 hypothetical protein O7604_00790 [Micromonospora sp. WMMA1947]
MTSEQEQSILAVHIRGLDGMCAGCRLWWARLTPYPCWQVEWATSRQCRLRLKTDPVVPAEF